MHMDVCQFFLDRFVIRYMRSGIVLPKFSLVLWLDCVKRLFKKPDQQEWQCYNIAFDLALRVLDHHEYLFEQLPTDRSHNHVA